ncbi:MAG: DUF4412 domain-containing protein [candidate division KSB1 bacterium]|nr:DUF4412 domain-containing protein [candidate division KSB1 bacterium]MDZ7319765.1 DUF4412 domain-containing protein [candidate division KSB1 bacterium]MDZ7342234.1 DUF4412 domain-containing protein [candidate division KSB1 bacterium]
MKQAPVRLAAGLLSLAFVMVLFNDNALAQKRFEGFWEQQSTRSSNLRGQPPSVIENEKVFYKPGKMKLDNLSTGKIMIIRLDKELMWNLDSKNKTYSEMTFAEMEQSMAQAQSAMKEQMNQMDPEQRKMMEKMMGKKMSDMFGSEGGMEISLKRSGKKQQIMGYECEQVFMYMNNEPLLEMWMTEKYDLGTEFLELYHRMGLMKGKLSDDARKIHGISLLTKTAFDTGMGKLETTTKVTRIVPTSVSDSEFEVPRGYTKQKLGFDFDE